MAVYNINGNELTELYDVSGNSLSYAYDINGNVVFTGRSVEDVEVGVTALCSIDTSSDDFSPAMSSSYSPQGMAIYNGYIFQYFGDDYIRVFDADTYELVNSFSASNIGHGNGFQFANTTQSNGYPLCYVCDGNGWKDSPYVYVLSLTPDGYTKQSTITMPSDTGNLLNCTIDFETNTMYILGYSTTSYSTEGEMYVTIYDMDTETITQQFTVDYLGVEQGLAYRDGKLIISCSHYSASTTYFHIFDIETGVIESTYSYSKTTMEEYEDFHVVECSDGYYLITSNWITTDSVKYYRLLTVRFE